MLNAVNRERLEHLIREFSERRPANIWTSINMLPQLLSAGRIDVKTD